MARVVTGASVGAVDPLKHSAPLGGALAFLGLARCMPLLHGSQGCSAFAKALLTRHFREPIPLQTTALTEVTAVLGGDECLAEALSTIAARHRPDVIGVLTTGLTEANGEDVAGTLNVWRQAPPGLGARRTEGPVVVHASTPDFKGGLQDGWAAAVEAIVTAFSGNARYRVPGQITVLTSPALSAVDVDEVRELVRAFGLEPIVVPDLSGCLDGHLADGWSPLTTGGTTVAELRGIASSEATIVAGSCVAGAGAILETRAGVPVRSYDRLAGLGAVDALVADLADQSGRPVPEPVRRWRRRLADGLLDAHFVLGGRRVALALEPDLLLAVASQMAEVGAEIVAAVAPQRARGLAEVPCEEVVIGDLCDLEARAADGGAELVIAGSHARAAAARLGAAHLCLGFPVYDRLGAQLRPTAGYRGSLALLIDAANCLLDQEHVTHQRTVMEEIPC